MSYLSYEAFRRLRAAYAMLLALVVAVALSAPAHADLGFDAKRGVMTLAPTLAPIMPAVVQIVVEGKNPEDPEQSEPRPDRRQQPSPHNGPGRERDPHDLRPGASPTADDPEQRRDRPDGVIRSGSGVIIDAKEGLIMTNHHVIANASRIRVRLVDGREFIAQRIGSDRATDVGLIKVSADNLVAAPIGSSEELLVGDFVIAIGYPFGLEQTVTLGVVSGLSRATGSDEYEDFIQTDAAINPGNSGGALVDTRGQLVGINTQIYSPSRGNIGIGFAVPTSIAIPVIEQLKTYGEVRRGRLGVEIRDVTPEVARALSIREARGALITSVTSGSPGENAGLKAGDVVVRVNNKTVRRSRDLKNSVGLSAIEAELKVVVVRDGKEVEIKVKLTPPRVAAGSGFQLLGASFGLLPADNPMAKRVRGVLVTQVEADSPAARTGLQRGDIIVEVNRKDTPTLDALKAELDVKTSVAALTVLRGNSEHIIILQRSET
jgi:Do/DeqQ family serine protease